MGETKLVFFSASGTTKKIATAVAASLGKEVVEHDLLKRPQETSVVFEAGDAAVFAMPVFAGRIPAICVDMLKQFKGSKTPAIALAVYGNREYDDALLELVDLLNENGFVVVAAAAFVAQHSIFPKVAQGRPDASDEQKIAAFGQECRKLIAGFSGAEKIAVKGNHPYRDPSPIPMIPSGSANCDECGTCVALCPTKAISADAPRKTNKSLCISCTACITACPQHARSFGGPVYAVASKSFEKKNAGRKEPEFFYA
ncbi:MAG: 4Fe-4S binding protein [Raoultibacter sp.]